MTSENSVQWIWNIYIYFYYIDTGLLLEIHQSWNSYETASGTWVAIFHILTNGHIDDVISRFFTAVCVWMVVCLYNKQNITRYIEDMNFMFLPLEHKIHIFSPPCNILYLIYLFIYFFLGGGRGLYIYVDGLCEPFYGWRGLMAYDLQAVSPVRIAVQDVRAKN